MMFCLIRLCLVNQSVRGMFENSGHQELPKRTITDYFGESKFRIFEFRFRIFAKFPIYAETSSKIPIKYPVKKYPVLNIKAMVIRVNRFKPSSANKIDK